MFRISFKRKFIVLVIKAGTLLHSLFPIEQCYNDAIVFDG